MWTRVNITLRRRIAIVVSSALVLVALLFWQVYPHFSLKEAFRRSKPELTAYAEAVIAPNSTALSHPPRRLGYFNVLKVEPLPNGFLFESDYGTLFDRCGLAYSTVALREFDTDAAGKVRQTFTPIAGNWYSFFRP